MQSQLQSLIILILIFLFFYFCVLLYTKNLQINVSNFIKKYSLFDSPISGGEFFKNPRKELTLEKTGLKTRLKIGSKTSSNISFKNFDLDLNCKHYDFYFG